MKTLETHRGVIPHTEIIGKRVRDLVKTTKGHEYRIHEPTLSEYVRYTPRSVTPVSFYKSAIWHIYQL
jgi:tRNA (adenine57-N1/adenine58-N1)-methyltransferase catalytic subunit